MGVDVELKVQNLSLLYWKSYFDKSALGMFFTDNDLVITENVKYDAEDSANNQTITIRILYFVK